MKNRVRASVQRVIKTVKGISAESIQRNDLVVFADSRWDYMYRREQHLMTRFARVRRVFFVEEPVFDETLTPKLAFRTEPHGVRVIVPHIPHDCDLETSSVLTMLISRLMESEQIQDFTSWYTTPLALSFTAHLKPRTIIYDCLQDLSKAKGAAADLLHKESELLRMADVVLTSGPSHGRSKQSFRNVEVVSNGVDVEHFARARRSDEPFDQSVISGRRVGFCGVIDERVDLKLIGALSRAHPDWEIMMIGPLKNVRLETLPRAANIHYLGKKEYSDLPKYMAGWDLALLPFVNSDSTQTSNPAVLPEYLAAGLRIVSTAIPDVINGFESAGLVTVARSPVEFISEASRLMMEEKNSDWAQAVASSLPTFSWDRAWAKVAELEANSFTRRSILPQGLFTPGLSGDSFFPARAEA